MVIGGLDIKLDFKVDIKRDFRGDIREYFKESIFLAFKGSKQVREYFMELKVSDGLRKR